MADQAEPVELAKLAFAFAIRRDVDTLRSREDLAGLRIGQLRHSLDKAASLSGDGSLGAQVPPDRDRPLEGHGHTSCDTPVVGADQ